MKVLSLFDGIGCGMVALERAGISVEEYIAYEIDKNAIKVSKANYPQIEHKGDVFDGDFTQYKGFDLLMGGSPCTHWSIAKKDRETTSDGLGFKLFMQYKRALDESGCKYFLYENNFGIHKDIKQAITDTLDVEPILINSALVSAQQRKRMYWTNIPNVNPPEDKQIYLKDVIENALTEKEKSYCITATYCNSGNLKDYFERSKRQLVFKPIRIGDIGSTSQAHRVCGIEGKSVTINANGGGQGAKTGLYKIDLPDGDYYIRRLMPVECERLQTLPEDYTKGISDTQRYKCIGNGWTVDIISHILSYL